MAGFLDAVGFGRLRNNFIKLSKLGRDFDSKLVQNSQAIGYIEGELRKRGGIGAVADDLLKYSMAISDTTSQLRTKTLAFFQLDYITKKEKLRDIASNAEIEFVLDTITDDTIIYDDRNRFCFPTNFSAEKLNKRNGKVEEDNTYSDEVVDSYYERFDDIYTAWGFNNGNAAWQYFYQWLIEGHLAFEMIYDSVTSPKNIIGFKDLDPATLYPLVKKDHKGTLYLEWLQRDDINNVHRTLTDAQIIYISYSNTFRTKRVSFTERMIRSFNLLRIMEQSKVIWHLMNAPIRMKTSVPIGTKSLQKAKEDVKEYLNMFKEDIYFNQDTGELLVDGKPKILYYKNYITPKNAAGESIDIEAIEHHGPDLQDSQLLAYFLKKLKLDSKLPFSRWDYNEGGGSYLLGPDTVSREEIAYGKFIKRLRTAFQELMLRPWYLQLCIDYPDLKTDNRFKNAIGMSYVQENVFEEMKDSELATKRTNTITALQEIKNDPESVLHVNFLLKKYMKMTEEDIRANQQEWDLDDKEPEKGEASASNAETSDATAQGGDSGGEDFSTQDETQNNETGTQEAGGVQAQAQAGDLPGVGAQETGTQEQ